MYGFEAELFQQWGLGTDMIIGLGRAAVVAKKNKKLKDQSALYIIASVSCRRCESYGMYLEGDSPHQIVIIMCKCT